MRGRAKAYSTVDRGAREPPQRRFSAAPRLSCEACPAWALGGEAGAGALAGEAVARALGGEAGAGGEGGRGAVAAGSGGEADAAFAGAENRLRPRKWPKPTMQSMRAVPRA